MDMKASRQNLRLQVTHKPSRAPETLLSSWAQWRFCFGSVSKSCCEERSGVCLGVRSMLVLVTSLRLQATSYKVPCSNPSSQLSGTIFLKKRADFLPKLFEISNQSLIFTSRVHKVYTPSLGLVGLYHTRALFPQSQTTLGQADFFNSGLQNQSSGWEEVLPGSQVIGVRQFPVHHWTSSSIPTPTQKALYRILYPHIY